MESNLFQVTMSSILGVASVARMSKFIEIYRKTRYNHET